MVRRKSLGQVMRFLLPHSLLGNRIVPGGPTVWERVHAFLLHHFGGYTTVGRFESGKVKELEQRLLPETTSASLASG